MRPALKIRFSAYCLLLIATSILWAGPGPSHAQEFYDGFHDGSLAYTNGGYVACYDEDDLDEILGFANEIDEEALLSGLRTDRCVIIPPNTLVLVQALDWSRVQVMIMATGDVLWTHRNAVFGLQ